VPFLELMNSQRFAIGELIKAAELRLHDFEWEREYSEKYDTGLGGEPAVVSKIVHAPTQSFFVFEVDDEGRHYNYLRPGETTAEEKYYVENWEIQLDYVRRWLDNIRRELAAPDLWAIAQEEVGELPSGASDTPFTVEEQAEVERHLRDVLEAVRERHELTEVQLLGLEEKVTYLVAEARRARRYEWRRLLLGSLMEAMVVYSLEADAFRDLMRFAVAGIGHLFGGPALLALT
jgi:hypothetical protein